MTERLTPERAVRLLRAKTDELELVAPIFLMEPPPTPDAIGQALGSLMADIALVASLLADHIERSYGEPVIDALQRAYIQGFEEGRPDAQADS